MHRGAYHSSNPDKARLPGVNGEPPKRVEGSSVLVTFSASYWRGVAPAGEDYGWRLVCFTAGGDATSDDAKSLILDAERAADRAQAVDAVNVLGWVGGWVRARCRDAHFLLFRSTAGDMPRHVSRHATARPTRSG